MDYAALLQADNDSLEAITLDHQHQKEDPNLDYDNVIEELTAIKQDFDTMDNRDKAKEKVITTMKEQAGDTQKKVEILEEKIKIKKENSGLEEEKFTKLEIIIQELEKEKRVLEALNAELQKESDGVDDILGYECGILAGFEWNHLYLYPKIQ